MEQILNGTYKRGAIPPMWDGKTTKRVLEVINQIL
jgi:hypothetical protein